MGKEKKILVVAHRIMMKALTAEYTRYNHMKLKSIFSPYDLVRGKDFEKCEIYPMYLDIKPSHIDEQKKLL